ncbi:fructokinase [Sphingomonas sp. YR710]|uniref:ROK family protein n=1 Tax=Sphingomonas sp. YR710 TaxID=1882773 RepID=UPI00088003FC|nr:ROK family protein [Sphingomonas sp. YR710]SDC53362.1 fructokinase [Sphingomonas sp. YR710]
MNARGPLLAGVELGGTKCIAALARDGVILQSERWPTGDDAQATLSRINDWLDSAPCPEPIASIGIASFGPLCLDPASSDYGRIVNTPKPGWAGVDVLGILAGGRNIPAGFDTDVAGAALAEGRWGASIGCSVHIYLTIGTGIGGGVVVDGKPLHGLLHPEIGHIRIRRLASDSFPGTCPFHGDCLEGLASGPAIAARAGLRAEALADTDPVWQNVADDLAELMAMLILTLSPQRIVIGGGVAQGHSALLSRVHKATADRLAGYLAGLDARALEAIIVLPTLGDKAGILGAIALADSAFSR